MRLKEIMHSFLFCYFIVNLYSFSDHIFSDRRGIVTPEYRAEHESIGDDNMITNNKTYGTAKIVQPQVIMNYSYSICQPILYAKINRLNVIDVVQRARYMILQFLIFLFFLIHYNSQMVRRFKQVLPRISRAR